MKNLQNLPPIIHHCMTIGTIPTSYKISLTYEEQLMWFCKFLEDEVIPVVNNNSEAVKELQNWFENLDVQEEINNKLDDMAESGQLQEIIAEYLELTGLNTFDTVSDMKLAENVISGTTIKTLGYHSVGDGGSAIYKVREVTNADTVDEMLLIALSNPELVAELIVDTKINVKQLGAYGEAGHDDTTVLQTAINSFNDIYIPDGSYYISSTLNVSQAKKITGEVDQRSKIYYNGTGSAIEIKYSAWRNVTN